jgi:hypothetical protein
MQGFELSRRYYEEAVRPILEGAVPGVPYAAALIGEGSEVLGFDTEMSQDHDWGPRLQVFLSTDDFEPNRDEIMWALNGRLPATFLGLPTTFAANDDGTGRLEVGGSHRVAVDTLDRFVSSYLGFDIHDEIRPADWLSFPEQKLRTLIEGAVFHDEIGLDSQRGRFEYYPRDVWLYQLASVWESIGQEEHLVGRAGYVGDELGASLIASRLVRDMMRLAFMLARTYSPYPKWFGSAFKRLPLAERLTPLLGAVIRSIGWKERDDRLAATYECVAEMQDASGLLPPVENPVRPFFGRPFHVVQHHAEYAQGLRGLIQDPEVARIAARRNIGGIDVFSDSTDLLSYPEWRGIVRQFYT